MHDQGVSCFANLDGWSVAAFVRPWLLNSPLDHSANAIESGQKPPFTNLHDLLCQLFNALLFACPRANRNSISLRGPKTVIMCL